MKNFLAFFVICFIVLSLPFCVADKSSDKAVAATIGAGGIVFIASNLGTVSKLFSAVADPTGAISSAVFSKIAEGVIASSPELAPVIQTYQKINKLKELGGEIGTDMQISDKGEIVGGSMSMDSQGPNQMGDMFGYENKDAVDVVNSDIEFGEDGKSAVVMGEGSVLKMDGIVEVSGTEDAAVEVQKISMNERGGV